MIATLFAIVVAVSSIAALRRNPSYTGRSLLRTIPVILLAVAAIIALVIAVIHLTAGRSANVTIAAILATCLVGILFLAYVLYKLFTPRDARLTSTIPHGTPLLSVHRRIVYRWAGVVAILLLLCGVLRLVLPGLPGYFALIFGGIVLFISSFMLPVYYVTSRMMDVALTALEADPWIHWTYTPDQWAQWSEVQVARLAATPSTYIFRRDWRKPVLVFALIAAGIYLFSPGSYLWRTGYLLVVLLIMVAIDILDARARKSAPDKFRARLRTASPEVFFGRDGLYANGILTTWRSTDLFLNRATVDDRSPRSLLFCFEKDVPNPYGPLNVIPIDQAILLPTGKEHDLATLQQRLTERCPSAQIALC